MKSCLLITDNISRMSISALSKSETTLCADSFKNSVVIINKEMLISSKKSILINKELIEENKWDKNTIMYLNFIQEK